MSDNKFFILDCIKFNFKFLDSLDECIRCSWINKLTIPIVDIKNREIKELAAHIEGTVNMYRTQRIEELLNKIGK